MSTMPETSMPLWVISISGKSGDPVGLNAHDIKSLNNLHSQLGKIENKKYALSHHNTNN